MASRICATLALSTLALGCGVTESPDSFAHLEILVPAAPGGGWDQCGRALQQAMLSENLVSRVTVENRGGAGGTIGLAQFVSSRQGRPDVLMVSGMVMLGAIQMNRSIVTLSQATPIARLAGEYEAVVVPVESPIRSVQDLVEQFKANPGSVAWGGGSAGSPDQILAAMIAQAVGVDPSRVNYIAYAGGGEALAAILGGHVTVGVSGYAETADQIKAGRLRALAISSDQRIPGIDSPTLIEQGIPVQLSNWRGVFAPPGITDARKQELIGLLQRTVKTESWQQTLQRNQWTDLFLAGDQFKTFLDAERLRVEKIMASVGLLQK